MKLDGGIDMYTHNFDNFEIVRIGNTTCKGRKVFFLNYNGYDSELERARKYFDKGQILTVEEIEVGRSSSNVKFEGVDEWFNTVMFEDLEEVNHE